MRVECRIKRNGVYIGGRIELRGKSFDSLGISGGAEKLQAKTSNRPLHNAQHCIYEVETSESTRSLLWRSE